MSQDYLNARLDSFERNVVTRLDRIEGKVDGHTERIVTIEVGIETAAKNTRATVARWSAVVSAAAVAVFEAIRRSLT